MSLTKFLNICKNLFLFVTTVIYNIQILCKILCILRTFWRCDFIRYGAAGRIKKEPAQQVKYNSRKRVFTPRCYAFTQCPSHDDRVKQDLFKAVKWATHRNRPHNTPPLVSLRVYRVCLTARVHSAHERPEIKLLGLVTHGSFFFLFKGASRVSQTTSLLQFSSIYLSCLHRR